MKRNKGEVCLEKFQSELYNTKQKCKNVDTVLEARKHAGRALQRSVTHSQ
jgi:hypothetical protein